MRRKDIHHKDTKDTKVNPQIAQISVLVLLESRTKRTVDFRNDLFVCSVDLAANRNLWILPLPS
jgi:hypothetical protein